MGLRPMLAFRKNLQRAIVQSAPPFRWIRHIRARLCQTLQGDERDES